MSGDPAYAPHAPHYVYRMFGEGGAALYVGCSGNIGSRLLNHQSQRPWFDEVLHVEFDRYPDEATAKAAERDLIGALAPRYNAMHNPDRPATGGWATRRRNQAAEHARGVDHGPAKGCRECSARHRERDAA